MLTFRSLLCVSLLIGTLLVCSLESAYAKNGSKQWPSTLDEAVSELVTGLSDEDKKTLCQTKKEDLIQYHFGWGMGIRNGFGLWGGNKALLRSACGGELCHPDDASMIIIEHVWQTLQSTTCTK